MKIVIILALVALSKGQSAESPDPLFDEPPPTNYDIGTELIAALINSGIVQSKLQTLYQVVDLKIRLVHLVKNLVTRDNLLLLRQFLDFVVRVSNFIMGYLPEPVPVPDNKSFLEGLFPIVTLNEQHPENSYNVQRVDREVNFTKENEEVFEKHKDDVVQVAKLIYGTP